MRLTRPSIAASIAIVSLFGSFGSCTLLLQREREQCQTSEDCQGRASGAVCTSQGLCEAVTSAAFGGAPNSGCERDMDCDDWSVCRAQQCQRLLASGCQGLTEPGAASDSERLPLVALMDSNVDAVAAALQAVQSGFAQVAGAPRVLGIACTPSERVFAQLRAARVTAVLTAGSPDQLESITQRLSGQAVVFAASADAPSLRLKEWPGWVVSCRANRSDEGATLLSAAQYLNDELLSKRELITEQPLLAASERERQLGYDTIVSDSQLMTAGFGRLSYDSTDDPSGFVSALAALSSPARLLIAPSDLEDWSANLSFLFKEGMGSASLPFVLLRAYSIQSAFSERVFLLTRGPETTSIGETSDCAFLAAYASVAAQLRFATSLSEASPETILLSLRSLVGGTTKLDANDAQSVLETLRARSGAEAALDLVGRSGELELGALPADRAHIAQAAARARFISVQAEAQELYCADRRNGTLCATGARFASSGARLSPANRDCSCWSSP